MTDAPLDLEAIRADHFESKMDTGDPDVSWCACGDDWPCDAVVLIAEVERLRGILYGGKNRE